MESLLRFTRLVALPVLAALTACASGPIYQTPPDPPSGYGTLILYRGLGVGAWPQSFFINGSREFASLNEIGYAVVSLKAGQHVVTAGTGGKAPSVTLSVVSGETYFVKYETWPRPGPYPSLNGQMATISKAIGAKEIASYRLQPASVQRVD
jgi:hypothetical protein